MRLAARLVLFVLSATAFPTAAMAGGDFTDWQVGDFIFYESTTPQAHAIRVATNSRYTHMGIVDRNEKGFYVLEAGRTVTETPLETFVNRGVDGDYAVYRLTDLDPDLAEKALEEARTYLGLPYDIFFRIEKDAIYCSELPHHAFAAMGIDLGDVERLGDLDIDTAEGREIFLSRWEQHPDCGGDMEACWSVIEDQAIVTPISIARDGQVEQVFSTFDAEEV